MFVTTTATGQSATTRDSSRHSRTTKVPGKRQPSTCTSKVAPWVRAPHYDEIIPDSEEERNRCHEEDTQTHGSTSSMVGENGSDTHEKWGGFIRQCQGWSGREDFRSLIRLLGMKSNLECDEAILGEMDLYSPGDLSDCDLNLEGVYGHDGTHPVFSQHRINIEIMSYR
jgi:hypothetical protein